MTIGSTGPDRNVGGDRNMAGSFDVLVRSVEALNGTIQQLSRDMQRGFEAQARFTPGQHGGDAARRARDNIAGDGQTRVENMRGSASRYNPQAGTTDQEEARRTGMSMSGAARWAFQRFTESAFSGAQGHRQGQNQTQGQTQTQSQFGQPVPPYNPSTGYTFGPQTPFGGSQGGAGGPGGGGGHSGGGGGAGGGHGGGGGGFGGGGGGGHGGGFGGGHGGRGGGWSNMAQRGLSRLPYIGAGMKIAGGVQNLYLSEREKNRRYQSIEGTDNLGGFGERMSEEGYRWSMPGMSGAMARQTFQAVTSLGYNERSDTRQGRQDALNFVYHNYNARGMDPEESIGILQTASKDATVSFGELSEALKDVSDTAGRAGVNAKFMRQNFQQMLGTAVQTGAGPGASELAQIFTSTQASYGREFQGSDFRGQLNTSYQYMIGAQYGVSPGRLQGIMRNQPGEYARMVTGSQNNWINTVFSPAQIQDLKGLIKKYGSNTAAIPTIEQEFLNTHPELDLNVIAQNLSGPLTGVQLDNSNVMDWVIQQLAGNTAAAHGAQTSGNKPVDANKTQGTRTGQFGLVAPKGNDSIKGQIEDMNVHGPGDSIPGARFFSDTKNKAGQNYLKGFYNKGKRDPVLEAILQNVKNPNSTKVRVSTAKGDRIISFEEAMRLYPNEMTTGKVQFVTGEEAGKSTSDVVGGNVDASRDIRGELTNAEGQRKGETVEHYEKKHGKIKQQAGNDKTQRVTVDLSAEAKRLLQLLPSVNNESQATGYPPYNPNSRQGSRGGH